MGIIKASRLVFDYITRDDDEKVQEVNRALDHVDLEITPGSLLRFWDTTDPENPRLPKP